MNAQGSGIIRTSPRSFWIAVWNCTRVNFLIAAWEGRPTKENLHTQRIHSLTQKESNKEFIEEHLGKWTEFSLGDLVLRAPETCRGREDKEKERTGNTLKRNEERIRNAREIHKGTLGKEKRTNEKLYGDQKLEHVLRRMGFAEERKKDLTKTIRTLSLNFITYIENSLSLSNRAGTWICLNTSLNPYSTDENKLEK